MTLKYDEILKLKGKTLLHKEHQTLHKVTSATKNWVTLDNGIKCMTIIFYETRQKDYEIVAE